MFRAILLAVSAWLILGFAPAKWSKGAKDVPSAEECHDDKMVNRCDPEQQRRVRELFGVKPIEAHRDSGDQVRRAFYVDGYGYEVIAIAFIRPKRGDPSLWIHFPRESDGKRYEPLRVSVSLEIWNDVIRRSSHFHEQLRRLPEVPSASGEIRLCLHSWVYTVEATDPAQGKYRPATLRRKTEDSCDNGLAKAYADELQRAAMPLLAPCARLDPRRYRNDAKRLSSCRILSGDRLAAADVANRADHMGSLTEAKEGELEDLFDRDATVDWNGERNSGAGSAAKFWAAKALGNGGADFYIEEIEGESANRVILKGVLFRSIDGPDDAPSIQEMARVEQIWTNVEGDFSILSATVEPFERQPPAKAP